MAEKKLALRTAEAIYEELMRPENQRHVILTPQQARDVWQVFRKSPIDVVLVTELKPRAFLQAAMMSAIDASFAMSWIETIFRSAYKPSASVKGILTALVKTGLKHFYRSLKGGTPELYQAVIDSIVYSHRPYFGMIQNGETELM